MLWGGDLPIQEYSDTHVYTTVYDQGSFKPVARLAWLRDDLLEVANDEPENDKGWYGNDKPVIETGIQIYYYHNDQLGTPNELTNSQGEVVWLADYEAWGNTAKVVWREQLIDQMQVSQYELQPIRFQGQYFDEETGLHYNRFRYYDPDVGMFTTRDPIGLMGGDNVFAYAPNPTGWIDPLGLMEIYSHRSNNKNEGYVQNYEFRFKPPADKATEKVAGQVAKKVPVLKRLNQLVGGIVDSVTGKPSVKSESKQCTSLDTELVKVYERTGKKANVYTDRVSRNSAEQILNMMRKQDGFIECYPNSTQTILNNADKNHNESIFEKYVTPWAKSKTGQ